MPREGWAFQVGPVSQIDADPEFVEAHGAAAKAFAAKGDGTYNEAGVQSYFLFKILRELEKLNARTND